MTLPTGTISMSQVNTELGYSSTATISLNDTAVRSLAGVPSGTISMSNLQGKSAAYKVTLTGVNVTATLPIPINDLRVGCDRNVVNTTKPTTASYICAANTGTADFYRSQNRGNTWSLVRSGAASTTLIDIDGKAQSTSASTFCALINDTSGTRTVYVSRSTNSGASWATVSLPAFNKNTSLAAICANQYPGSTEWMAVVGPTTLDDVTAYVVRSTDSGATWSSVGTITTTATRSNIGQCYIACSNDATTASRWMICLDTDGIWSSTNSGTSWSRVLTSTRFAENGSLTYGNGIWATCVRPINAATMGYKYSSDNGSTWNFVQFPNAASIVYVGAIPRVNYVEDYVSGGGYFTFSIGSTSGGNYYVSVFISTNGTSITNTPPFSGTWGPGYTAYQSPIASYGPMVGPNSNSSTAVYCIVPS